MEKNKVKVPKIRFPGFTDEWEQRKLSDIMTEKLSNGVMNRPGSKNSNVKHINVINMYAPDKIHPEDLTASDYGDKTIQSCNVEVGDIFMTRSSLKPEGIAEPNVLLDAGIYVFDDHLIRMKIDKAKYNPLFVKINLGFTTIKSQFIRKSKTTAFTTIGQDDIADCVGCFPQLTEQEQIGTFFSNIDNLITLHQRKLNHLQAQKKGLLQKMFPKDGERFPELRFLGFTDVWEVRKLGEVANIVGGGTPSTSNPAYWNGSIDWYSPVEIGNQIYVSGSQKKLTELGLQKSSANMLPIGAILFTSRAGIGNTAILEKPGCTNQGFQSIVPYKEKLDSYFIFSRTRELKRYGEMNGAGSTFVEVSGKQMAKMEISIPSIKEQKQIGEFFTRFDNLITLHQRKLTHLQQQKKALLQQMFV